MPFPRLAFEAANEIGPDLLHRAAKIRQRWKTMKKTLILYQKLPYCDKGKLIITSNSELEEFRRENWLDWLWNSVLYTFTFTYIVSICKYLSPKFLNQSHSRQLGLIGHQGVRRLGRRLPTPSPSHHIPARIFPVTLKLWGSFGIQRWFFTAHYIQVIHSNNSKWFFHTEHILFAFCVQKGC